jgi:TIR domain
MYNLFVAYDTQASDGPPWQIDLSRCVQEYTDTSITERFGGLDSQAVSELKRLPSVFAYEAVHQLPPRFGVVRDVVKRQGQVRIEYVIQQLGAFLSAEDLQALTFQLDIGEWELKRTHWAVKDVNLPKELHAARGIVLPPWTRQATKTVDITQHNFEVAFSFPGETRAIVEDVARELESRIGPNSYFYDNNYVSQLARPSLDTLLQDIYRNRARLVVVFVGADYQRKDWCGIEFRAIREIIMERGHERILFVRTDDGVVEGVFKTDGYIDIRRFSASRVAEFICERLDVLSLK